MSKLSTLRWHGQPCVSLCLVLLAFSQCVSKEPDGFSYLQRCVCACVRVCVGAHRYSCVPSLLLCKRRDEVGLLSFFFFKLLQVGVFRALWKWFSFVVLCQWIVYVGTGVWCKNMLSCLIQSRRMESLYLCALLRVIFRTAETSVFCGIDCVTREFIWTAQTIELERFSDMKIGADIFQTSTNVWKWLFIIILIAKTCHNCYCVLHNFFIQN